MSRVSRNQPKRRVVGIAVFSPAGARGFLPGARRVARAFRVSSCSLPAVASAPLSERARPTPAGGPPLTQATQP